MLGAPCTRAQPRESSTTPQDNPIVRENARPGDPNWRSLPTAVAGAIEGYATSDSVTAGDILQLHVSTSPAASYTVKIFRLGWYGGDGARRVACWPSCNASEQGVSFPTPAPDHSGFVQPDWPVTDSIVIASSWVSGLYLVRLELTSGPFASGVSWIPLVVRAPAGSPPSNVLVQVPDFTWAAYNPWGGKSLYGFNSSQGVAATRVSLLRPYSDGSVPLTWEFPVVQFLEREGIDLSYQTDEDTDREPQSLLQHRLVVVAGHDEYWTQRIRDAFDAARDHDTNLAFIGANIGYWRVRLTDSGTTLEEYRTAALDPGPPPQTGRFRDTPYAEPECALMGVQYMGGSSSSASESMVVSDTGDAQPWFSGTGLTPGEVIPGLVSYEWDSITECSVPPLVTLLHYGGSPATGDTVLYVAPSGSTVFSAGTLLFGWALSGYPGWGPPVVGIEHLMRNILKTLSRPNPPLSVTATLLGGTIRVSVDRISDSRSVGILVGTDPATSSTCTSIASTCTLRPPGNRTYRIVARDLDRWGASAPTESTAIYVPNHSPVVSRIATHRHQGYTVLQAVTHDADGDSVRCRWIVDRRQQRTSSCTAKFASAQHACVIACDGEGGVSKRLSIAESQRGSSPTLSISRCPVQCARG